MIVRLPAKTCAVLLMAGLGLTTVALSLLSARFEGFDRTVWRELSRSYARAQLQPLRTWEKFLIANQGLPTETKLQVVNDFINRQIRYVTDDSQWAQDDYWATPFESLVTGAGDCEDYVIAKYFSLLLMGVAESQLRILYVTALDWDEPHMVLIFLPEQGVPQVLDNLRADIVDALQRTDLTPIYSFNADGFWLANASGLGGQVAGKKGVPKWTRVLDRLPGNLALN